ncbi:MAG: hypothetical protein U0800_03480 [Isosphaeraceae bacterium]
MNPRLATGLALFLLAGCGAPPPASTPAPVESASSDAPPPPPPPVPQEALIPQTPPSPPSMPVAAAPTPEESRPRDTLGKTTSDVRDAQAEQARGGVATTGKIASRDPIRIAGNAYVSIVGQSAVLNIKKAVDLFHAQNDRYPADTKEFLEQIIQANNIRLPQLPYYQEYAYDAESHSLIVMEYPARKEARERELNK